MPLSCPTCTGTASPHLGELARLDALVAELRHALAAQSEALVRHAAVTAAAQKWRDNGCTDDHTCFALIRAIDAMEAP